ncbi:MAG: hypothetical protein ACRETT_16290 [Steroidobacteraceae bacterium]
MSPPDNSDDDWLDALAGRERSENTAAAREARQLRAAIRARPSIDDPDVLAEDDERAAELIDRARREGLLKRKEVAHLATRTRRWRSLAAAAIACLAVAFVWQMRPGGEAPVIRGQPDAIHRVQAEDPARLQREIIEALAGAGVDAAGYENLGRQGIDAELPEPLTSQVREVLERFDLPEPVDGVLRVEIAEP